MSFEILSLETLEQLAAQYGYWAIFWGILLENAGIPLPGETITLVGGFLAGSGDLHYGLVVLSAFSGAVVGDNCGYWIGRLGGWPLLLRVGQLFRMSEAQLQAVKEQFSQNAAKAVLVGRFVTLLRIFAGPLAGIAAMPYGSFLVYNAVGAGLWSVTMVTLAFFVGRLIPLPQLVKWVAQFGVLALGLIVIWLVWQARRRSHSVSARESSHKSNSSNSSAQPLYSGSSAPISELNPSHHPEAQTKP
jgi:membrane protein DedA with SNARE-associated domain